MKEKLFVQADDGTEREVTDPVERASIMADVMSETALCDVEFNVKTKETKRVVVNATNEAAHRARWAVGKAKREAVEARTAIVTVDDGVRTPHVETIELVNPVNDAGKASVVARFAKKEGVLPTQVRVETLDEHEARTGER